MKIEVSLKAAYLLLVVLSLSVIGVDGFFYAGKQNRHSGTILAGRLLALGARSNGGSKRGGSVESLIQQMLSQMNDMKNSTAANFARIDANFARIDANFARIDANFNDMKNSTAVNFARVDASLKQLIDYNHNRDSELELQMRDVYFDALLKENWHVEIIDVDVIYSPDGKSIIEWDGILFGTLHGLSPTLFLIETKQVATLAKYNSLLERVGNMSSNILPKILLHNASKSDDVKYKSSINKLIKHLRGQEYNTAGVLASPGFPVDLLEQLRQEKKVGIVHLSQNQYMAVVQIPPRQQQQQQQQH